MTITRSLHGVIWTSGSLADVLWTSRGLTDILRVFSCFPYPSDMRDRQTDRQTEFRYPTFDGLLQGS